MPKILINEKDKTTPGTPGSYTNYAVLIPGRMGVRSTTSSDPKIVEPDANGVYEFSSVQAFEDTIGLCAPAITRQVGNGTITDYHYGNQMAYELLKLGYTVIYRPIENLTDLKAETFWDIFRDKASYDFRFVSHGLLESSTSTIEDTTNDTLSNFEDALNALDALKDEIAVLETEVYLDKKIYEYNAYRELMNSHAVLKSYDETVVDVVKQATTDVEKAIKEIKANTPLFTTSDINSVNLLIAKLASYMVEDNSETSALAPGRGDCIALLELDETTYTNQGSDDKPETQIIDAINTMEGIDKKLGCFCSMTVPSVYYKMSELKAFDNNTKLPGAFHYLACFINSLGLGFAEWYAAAGYTRGVSSYTVEKTTVKLGEIAINALEPRNYDVNSTEKHPNFACNVIANFRGNYYLWGNRTAVPIGPKGSLENGDLTAASFLNIRQLSTTIKKQLYVACRMFTFDPNSDTLWINFINAIKPTLERMKADQGIRDYKILKLNTDGKKATLKARIRIIPIEAVEDFDLEVSLEDNFGETTAVVTG